MNEASEPINPYASKYFTIVSKANSNTITCRSNNKRFSLTISISTDNGATWSNKTSSLSGVTLATLSNGGKLLIKGTNTAYSNGSYYCYFSSTQNFEIEGNIMSLLYGDNFANQKDLTGKNYAFNSLFWGCTTLTSIEKLVLPATTLAQHCYDSMFRNCTGLTTVPSDLLPATTLANYCYQYLFYGCTNLTTVPELPATTLADYCYSNMFYGCTNLTTVPELPATTLADYCYMAMFRECTSLTTAPELPAITLVSSCYTQMFYGCSSLNYIKAMFTTTPTTSYTGVWVNGVASTGTFVKNSAATWDVTGAYGVPSGWTVRTASS